MLRFFLIFIFYQLKFITNRLLRGKIKYTWGFLFKQIIFLRKLILRTEEGKKNILHFQTPLKQAQHQKMITLTAALFSDSQETATTQKSEYPFSQEGMKLDPGQSQRCLFDFRHRVGGKDKQICHCLVFLFAVEDGYK